MKRNGNHGQAAKIWSHALLLVAALSLVPGKTHGSVGGEGGVVCLSRVQDSSSSSYTSSGSTSSASSGTSLQTLFSQYAYLEFRGTTQALTALDSQLLALGSPDAKVRVSSTAIGAAGSLLDLSLPMSSLEGITVLLDTVAIGGGYGGVVSCTAGSASFLGTWTGATIALDFNPIAASALLWNVPVEVLLIPADVTRAVRLVIKVTDCGTKINVKLSPVATN